MSADKFAETLATVNRTMNATDEEMDALRHVAAIATTAPSGDAQGERAHGDGAAAQGSSAGDEGGKR